MNNLTPLLFLVLGAGFIFWMFWRARPEIRSEELRVSLKSGIAVDIADQVGVFWVHQLGKGDS